ncbi:MAG: MBL fold metallo-hydrolase [Chloroflexi bacterium]|nr:MBL fold metallo-hydrolase [Chloroflexota bacterium]
MRLVFLGTGTSHGVPTIDCMIDHYAHCPRGVCHKAQNDPRYRRTRTSLWVCSDGFSLLIDTSQDFRQQVLAQQVRRIDAVLYTHGHADHIYGLPDIRSYCRLQQGPIDIYGSAETIDILRRGFSYVFNPPPQVGGGIPQVREHMLDGSLLLGNLRVEPIPVVHGPLQGCYGYRLNDVAYLPDVHEIGAEAMARLQGLDLLILNCLRFRRHATHLSLEESLAYIEALRPRRSLLTHMTHDIDFEQDSALLPAGVAFAHDGLEVEA